MKKLVLILSFSLLLTLTSCSGKPAAETADTADAAGTVQDSAAAVTTGTPAAVDSPDGGNPIVSASDDELLSLSEENVDIIENQSFETDLDGWGKVRFVSSKYDDGGQSKAKFFLTRQNGKILYSFGDFSANEWPSLETVDEVAIRDVDNDGLKDIIIIASYITGIGQDGAVPFPVCSIYFQKNNMFYYDVDLETEINDNGQNKTADMVMKFIADRTAGGTEGSSGQSSGASLQKMVDKAANYAEFIDTEKESYEKREVDLVGYSSEGGTATGYFNAGSLSYAEASIMGEMGQVGYFIYFVDDTLRYVICTEKQYDKPITEEGSKISEENTSCYLISGNQLYLYSEGEPIQSDDTGLMETVGKIAGEFKK